MNYKLMHDGFEEFAGERQPDNSAPAFNEDEFCVANSKFVHEEVYVGNGHARPRTIHNYV